VTDQWKVLIYDQSCRDIISPLMNVGALRNKGVTLHLLVILLRLSFLIDGSWTPSVSQSLMLLWSTS
jgi:hypothetical protein